MDHQQQIEQIEEKKDAEYEYDNNNAEDIYDEDIDDLGQPNMSHDLIKH